MIGKRLPLRQKAVWIAVILSQIIIGLAVIIIPFPYGLLSITLMPLLAILYYKPFWGLLLLTFFLPGYPLTLFSIGRADVTLTELGFFIAFFCWILLCIRDNEIKLYSTATDIPIFLLFSWCLFSLFWTTSIDRGTFQIFKIIPGILTYYLFIHVTKDKKNFNLILFAWIVLAIFASIIGFYETVFYGIEAASKLVITGPYTKLTKSVRAESFFMGPDTLGFVLSLSIIMAITKYMITPSRKLRFFILPFLALMFFVLLSTFSRKSLLGLLAAIIYLGWRNKKALISFFLVSVVGFLLFILVASSNFLEVFLNRIQTYFVSPEVSISQRWTTWGIALQLFSESPIVGNGIGSFFISAQVLESPLNITHNFYVYILAELGLIGLALILFWYYQIIQGFNIFYKQNKDKTAAFIARGMVSGLIILLIQSFFRTFQLTEPLFWGFLGITSAFLKVYMPEKSDG